MPLCPGALRDRNHPTPPPPLYAELVDEKPALVPPPSYSDDDNQPLQRTPEQKAADEKAAAAEIVALLCKTDKTGAALRAELEESTLTKSVSTAGWSEWLAERIFHALRSMLGNQRDGKDTNWAVAFTDAYQTARATVQDHFRGFLQYAAEIPGEVAVEVVVETLLSLIAFGILVRMTKWVVRLLGFSEVGPVAGMYTHFSCFGTVCSFMCVYESDAQLKCFVSQGSFAAEWEKRYVGYIPRGSLFSYIQRMGMTWK